MLATLGVTGAAMRPDEQVETVRRALEQSLSEIERVRSLEIDDAVGLAVVFRPRKTS